MIRWDRTDRNQRLDAVTPHSRPARVLGGDGEGVQGIAFPIRGRYGQVQPNRAGAHEHDRQGGRARLFTLLTTHVSRDWS